MQDEKIKLIKKLTVVAPVSEVTDKMIEELNTLFKQNGGTTTLQFDIVDDEQNIVVNLLSKTRHVDVTQNIVDALGEMKSILYKIN